MQILKLISRTHKEKIYFASIFLVVASSGCLSKNNAKKNLRGGVFSKESFGDLPKLPQGKAIEAFTSTLDSFGLSAKLQSKKDAVLSVGDDFKCKIASGSVVDLISDVGKMYLIHVQNSALDASCKGIAGEFTEGYADKDKFIDENDKDFAASDNYPDAQKTSVKEEDSKQVEPLKNSQSDATCSGLKVYSKQGEDGGQSNRNRIIVRKRSSKDPFFIPGDIWRKGSRKNDHDFSLLVTGKGDVFRVSVEKTGDGRKGNAHSKMKTVDVKISDLRDEDHDKDTFHIPFSKFVERPGDWFQAKIQIDVVAIEQDKEVGKKCSMKIALMSPLVLDFSKDQNFKTVPLERSDIRFDLDGDGIQEQTGWIGKEAAFLVLDQNENGKVDSGKELFGNAASMANGASFADGFLALKAFDSNGDGKITSQDPVYPKLKLWFDANQNGLTDPGELVALSSRKVVSISLNYQKVPAYQALQGNLIYNDVRFSSSFMDLNHCKSGCGIYDVFFGTASSLTALRSN